MTDFLNCFLSVAIVRLHWMQIVRPCCDLLQYKWVQLGIFDSQKVKVFATPSLQNTLPYILNNITPLSFTAALPELYSLNNS